MNLKINVISPMLKPNNIEFNSKSIILSNNISIRRSPRKATSLKIQNKIIPAKRQYRKLKQKIYKQNINDNFLNDQNKANDQIYMDNLKFSGEKVNSQKKRALTAKSNRRYTKKIQNFDDENQSQNLKLIINSCQKKFFNPQTKNFLLQKNKTEEVECITKRSTTMLSSKSKTKCRQKMNTINNCPTPLSKSCKLNKNSQNLRISTLTSKQITESSVKNPTNGFLICKQVKNEAKEVYYNQCLSSLLIQRQINKRLNNEFQEQRFQTLIKKIKGQKNCPEISQYEDDNILFSKFNNNECEQDNHLTKNGQSSPLFSKITINPENEFSHNFSKCRLKTKNSVFKSALQWSNKRISQMKSSKKICKIALKSQKQEFQIDIDRWQGFNDIQPIPIDKFKK